MTRAFRPEDFKPRREPPRVRLPRISKRELIDAIREGVAQGVFDLACNATQAPTAAFFTSVQDGVTAAVERMLPPAAE